MKPLIIGEAPSRLGDVDRPIEGRIGKRLASFCGVDEAAYVNAFARVNVFPFWPGAHGRGSAFNSVGVYHHVQLLMSRLRKGRVVILLGKRVAKAFGVQPVYFIPQSLRGAHVYVVPHPSGVSHWYNDPKNMARMARFMRRVVWTYGRPTARK